MTEVSLWCRDSVLDQPQLPTDLLKRLEGCVQVVACVSRRDLAAHAGVALGDDRIPEAGREHPLVEQQLAHLDRFRRFAQNHRDDRGLAGKRFESGCEQSLAEVTGVVVQAPYSL